MKCKFLQAAKRKAWAAVRCRRLVRVHFFRVGEFVWPSDSQTRTCSSRAKILNPSILPAPTRLVVPQDWLLVVVETQTPPVTLQTPSNRQTATGLACAFVHRDEKVPSEPSVVAPLSSAAQVPIRRLRNLASDDRVAGPSCWPHPARRAATAKHKGPARVIVPTATNIAKAPHRIRTPATPNGKPLASVPGPTCGQK